MLRSALSRVSLSRGASPRFLSSTGLKESYEFIQAEKKTAAVGLITLHRPAALNALCDGLFADLLHAASALDKDDSVGCLVLTGSTKAFAAGADISEMKDRDFVYTYRNVGARCSICLLKTLPSTAPMASLTSSFS